MVAVLPTPQPGALLDAPLPRDLPCYLSTGMPMAIPLLVGNALATYNSRGSAYIRGDR